MEKEKVRELYEMPLIVKLNYCKMLALMTYQGIDKNPMKIAALYRLLARTRVAGIKRAELLDFMDGKEAKLETIGQELYEELNEQEKNIVKFSLIKDLIIIMRADYYEDNQEKELLKKAQAFFNIQEQHMQFFEEEYIADQEFNNGKFLDQNQSIRIKKEIIARATALGIPVAAIYLSTPFIDCRKHKSISIFKNKKCKKRGNKGTILKGLVAAFLLSTVTYEIVNNLLNLDIKDKEKIKDLTMSEIENIHNQAILYLKKDIEYLQYKIKSSKANQNMQMRYKQQKYLLERTLSVFKNTEPVLV